MSLRTKSMMAVVMCICMVVSLVPYGANVSASAPVAYESSDGIEVVQGVSEFDTDYFRTNVPNRLQAAYLFLTFLGLDQDAISYKGEHNFLDGILFSDEARNILAYLKANPQLGWGGIGNNLFDPLGEITAQAYRKVMLVMLGYQNFSWSEVMDLWHREGLYTVSDGQDFTFKDLETTTVVCLLLSEGSPYLTQASEALWEDGAVVLDLRSQSGRNQGHVKDSVHIPLSSFRDRASELSDDNTYLIYGSSETDAVYATAIMRGIGLQAYAISGGMAALRDAGAAFVEAEDIESVVHGWIPTELPVSVATLTIYDLEGHQVHRSELEFSSTHGFFGTAVKNMPRDFRIVVEAEVHEEEAETPLVLMADYSGFEPDTGYIYINVGTTIAAAYLDANPNHTTAEAMLAVKNFFDLPDWSNLGMMLHDSSEHFVYDLFLEQAAVHGGVNEYIGLLVAHIHNTTKSFRSESPMLRSVAGTIATELGKGAASYAGEQLMGWALKEMGLGFEDATASQIAAMREQLHNIERELVSINDKLKSLAQDVYSLSVPVAVMDNTNELFELLLKYIADGVYNETKKDRLLREIDTKILTEFPAIHNSLVGEPVAGVDGVLRQWSRIVKDKKRFLSQSDYDYIQTHFDFFLKIQEKQLVLIVEYLHAHDGYDVSDVEWYIERFVGNIGEQMSLLKEPIPQGMVVDNKLGTALLKPVFLDVSGKRISDVVAEMNSDKYLGFSDWRYMSTQNEVEELFAGSGNDVRSFLINNGWPAEMLRREFPFSLPGGEEYVLVIPTERVTIYEQIEFPFFDKIPNYRSWSFNGPDAKPGWSDWRYVYSADVQDMQLSGSWKIVEWEKRDGRTTTFSFLIYRKTDLSEYFHIRK